MNFVVDDLRLYKSQLAKRFSCTTRTISNWWARGLLPAPCRDEYRRPFNYASDIAEHEARLDRAEPRLPTVEPSDSSEHDPDKSTPRKK